MTTHRRKTLPVTAFEHAPVTCPKCYSVPKQPCRKSRMVGGILKLGAPKPQMCRERRTAAGMPPAAPSQRRGAMQQARQQAGGKKAKARANGDDKPPE